MKNLKKHSLLPAAVLGLSLAAYCLRRGLYAAAVDEKGLLAANHPLEAALWAVILAGAALIVLSVRKLPGGNGYEDNFGPSRYAPIGCGFMAATVLLMTLNTDFSLPGPAGTVWRVLGFLSAPGLVWAGRCRRKGEKPFFGIHACLCLFLLLYLVSRYQSWSGNPQLQDYVFELLAAVSLTLFSYHCAAFEAGVGRRRTQLCFGLLVILLWGAANFRAQVPALYFSGMLWALTDLCRLDLPSEKDKEDAHDPA